MLAAEVGHIETLEGGREHRILEGGVRTSVGPLTQHCTYFRFRRGVSATAGPPVPMRSRLIIRLTAFPVTLITPEYFPPSTNIPRCHIAPAPTSLSIFTTPKAQFLITKTIPFY